MGNFVIVSPLLQQVKNYAFKVNGFDKVMVVPPKSKAIFNFNLTPLKSKRVYYRSMQVERCYTTGNTPNPPFTVAVNENGERVIIYHHTYDDMFIVQESDEFLKAYTQELIKTKKDKYLGEYQVFRCPLTTYNTLLRISVSYPELGLSDGISEEVLNSVSIKKIFEADDNSRTILGFNRIVEAEGLNLSTASAHIVKYGNQVFGLRRKSPSDKYVIFDLKQRILDVSNIYNTQQ